jgi:hypothetical protein
MGKASWKSFSYPLVTCLLYDGAVVLVLRYQQVGSSLLGV